MTLDASSSDIINDDDQTELEPYEQLRFSTIIDSTDPSVSTLDIETDPGVAYTVDLQNDVDMEAWSTFQLSQTNGIPLSYRVSFSVNSAMS